MYQLEYADNMPLLGRTEFRYQQYDRSQQALRRLVKKRILSHVRNITVRRDYRLGGYFCEFFGLRLVFEFSLVLISVHIFIDKVEHIVAAAAGRVAEINNRNLVTVIFFGNGGCVAVEVALAVGSYERHSRRAAVFDVRVEEVRGLADAGRADHQRVDIRIVNERGHARCCFATADDQTVHAWKLLTVAP